MGKTSIQKPSLFSKTCLLKRSLIILLSFSAKTAPKDLRLENNLVSLLFENFWKILFWNSSPASVSNNYGFLFELIKTILKESFIVWALLFFKGIVQANFEKLSMITKTYL